MITKLGARLARRAAALAVLAVIGWTPPAEAGRDAALDQRQMTLVHKAEAEINRVRTMKSRFLQAASTGEISEGIVYLARPGRLRVEYDPPTPVLVVANGDYFTFVDTKLQQLSYLDLDATPAGLLLRKKVDLTDADIRIKSVEETPGIVEVTVQSQKDSTAGSLTLVFTQAPFALRQWRVTDAQGISTAVTLQSPETGLSIPEKLFETPTIP